MVLYLEVWWFVSGGSGQCIKKCSALLYQVEVNPKRDDKTPKNYPGYKSVTESEAIKHAANGGLAAVGYNPATGQGHLATYSVGENIEKGQVGNVGNVSKSHILKNGFVTD